MSLQALKQSYCPEFSPLLDIQRPTLLLPALCLKIDLKSLKKVNSSFLRLILQENVLNADWVESVYLRIYESDPMLL